MILKSHTTMSLLDKQIILLLNRNWQAIHVTNARTVFGQLAIGAVTALDIDLEDNMSPVTWDQWVTLPVREHDNFIGTPHGQVRVPTVVIASKFDKVPMRRPRLSRKNIHARDGGMCQYTGKKLGPNEGNLDHIIPRSRGGGSTWDNLVLADVKVNSRKGDKTPDEAGLRLIKKPTTPKAVPVSETISNPNGIKDWNHFLKAK